MQAFKYNIIFSKEDYMRGYYTFAVNNNILADRRIRSVTCSYERENS